MVAEINVDGPRCCMRCKGLNCPGWIRGGPYVDHLPWLDKAYGDRLRYVDHLPWPGQPVWPFRSWGSLYAWRWAALRATLDYESQPW